MNRLIIDASSILRALHQGGKDEENGKTIQFEGAQHQVNSAEYAYDKFIADYANVLQAYRFQPHQTVLVLDGMDSRSLRRAIYADYKGNRPKRPPEVNAEFNRALEGVIDELTSLGAICVQQDRMEADDVIAYLAQNLAGVKTIWSRDGDMLALMGPDVNVLLDRELNPPIKNMCPAEFIHVFKALVGDSSDNIKGAVGFGDAAWLKLVQTFQLDGLAAMKELIENRQLHTLAEDVPQLKELQKIIDGANGVYASYACAKFYPERVNTASCPLEIKMQVMRQISPETHPLLLRYVGTKRLVEGGFSGSMENWFKEHLLASPYVSLDIEASVGDKSEAWSQAIVEAKKGRIKNFVDVFGAKLSGLSLTFGANLQHTWYFPVDHANTLNVTSEEVMEVVGMIPDGIPVAIHNTAYELPVLYNEWEAWIAGAQDTMIMNSYVNENVPRGLKESSKRYFGYEQTTYESVTTKIGAPGTLTGGRNVVLFDRTITPAVIETPEQMVAADEETRAKGKEPKANRKPKVLVPAVTEPMESRTYRMNELSGKEVFDYGCDDTICTAALYNRQRFVMELEKTWQVFLDVEVPAQYWVAQAFIDGIDVDWDRMKELEIEDDAIFAKSWAFFSDYLKSINWPGTFYEEFQRTPGGIKAAYAMLTGDQLKTTAKTMPGVLKALVNNGAEEFANLLENADDQEVDDYLRARFTGEPTFDLNKDEHVRHLLFDVIGAPIRFRTFLTPAQRAKGQTEGTPQVDKYAFDHALKLDLDPESDEHKVVLAIREMNQVLTRKSLYYQSWPLYRHWKDGKVRPSLGQSAAATKRFTPKNPNPNQLPKKNEGLKVREIIRAYAGLLGLELIVAMDFSGQELVLAAHKSQDEMLLSCYVGDNKRDPHSLTGAGIAEKRGLEIGDYAKFVAAVKAKDSTAKKIRDEGKGTNFSSQYLCRAPKLAKMLVVNEEEAQMFLDAKNSVYSGLARWQQDVIAFAHEHGYTLSCLGTRRHLHEALSCGEKFRVLEAERQGVNAEIQTSGAEMTKLAVNEMQRRDLREKYGVRFMMPVHDETVSRVPVVNIVPAILEMHECMTQKYADVDIELGSDISIGWTFGTMKNVGQNPTPEKIMAVVAELMEELNVQAN